jgi:hypothetical protein
MREILKRATEIYNHAQYANDPDINKYVTNATTELQWAFAELQLGECKNSVIHLENALPMLQLIPRSQIKEQLNSQAGQVRTNINQACEN